MNGLETEPFICWTLSIQKSQKNGCISPDPLGNLQRIFDYGRLGRTGYLSILPMDQGVGGSAGASFAINPHYFDPENIAKIGMEDGCNAVASTVGVLGMVRRRDAHKISVIFKVNHNELLTYPNKVGRVLFETVRQALEMRAVAVGATIYFGSELWCYLHNRIFAANHDYNIAADLTGQANHLEVTIGVDLIKQKLPLNNGGYRVLNRDRTSYAKHDERMYTDLCSEHPIDLCRYQVANCYMGTVGLMNSWGASRTNDFGDASKAAVINERAGGTGLISGRKAFQRPMQEGIWLLHCIQDVYACKEVAVA